MQNDDPTSSHRDNGKESENNGNRETFYDIWQADDSSVGRSDDGYSESTPRLDNYAENCFVSDCASNRGQRSHPENIDETSESDRGVHERDGTVRVMFVRQNASLKIRQEKSTKMIPRQMTIYQVSLTKM